jgi:hypothetical protein
MEAAGLASIEEKDGKQYASVADATWSEKGIPTTRTPEKHEPKVCRQDYCRKNQGKDKACKPPQSNLS